MVISAGLLQEALVQPLLHRNRKIKTKRGYETELPALKQQQRSGKIDSKLSNQLVKLSNLKKYKVKRDMIEQMRENLRANLDKACNEDWRFILEWLGTKIMAFGDSTWDIEINIPVMKTSKTVDLITDKISCDFASKLRSPKTCEEKGGNSIFPLTI